MSSGEKMNEERLYKKLLGLDSKPPRDHFEESLIYSGKQIFSKTSQFTEDMFPDPYLNYFNSWKEFRDKVISDKDSVTMIGLARLRNITECVEDTIKNNIPGDLIETGVWRGGATILMKSILDKHKVSDKVVWLADSFKGVPPPDPKKYSADEGLNYHQSDYLAVSVEEVYQNFAKFGVSTENVAVLKGWFKDTLPRCSAEKFSVLRLDGDLYESTWDALTNLYGRLSKGGYIIIDDYGCIDACRQAVLDFRKQEGISEEMKIIDWSGVYWKKC